MLVLLFVQVYRMLKVIYFISFTVRNFSTVRFQNERLKILGTGKTVEYIQLIPIDKVLRKEQDPSFSQNVMLK